MKKFLLISAAFALLNSLATTAYGQTHGSLPGLSGDWYLGVEVGANSAFGSADCIIRSNNSVGDPYYGFEPTALKRGFSPSVSVSFRRVNEGYHINFGSLVSVTYTHNTGKAEGTSATNAFTTKYSFSSITLDYEYMIMIPVADDKVSINAGIAVALGYNLSPKSTIEYANGGTPINTEGGYDFFDLLKGGLGAAAGVDYNVTDNILASLNFTVYPFDFYSLMNEEHTHYFGVGEGLFVNNKAPWRITLGCYYYFD